MTELSLTIDNHALSVPAGTTVWEAARQVGVDIPVLCHEPKLNPVGVCRVCCVEVEGARVPAALTNTTCERYNSLWATQEV